MKLKTHILLSITILLMSISLSACNSKQEEINTSVISEQTTLSLQQTEIETESDSFLVADEPEIITADYTEMFQSINGCTVIYDTLENKYIYFNEDDCKTRVSPNSTFKIVSTLVGLHNQVITSAESKMGYDGTQYPNETWNADLGLKEAFQYSCVWYYKKLVESTGQDVFQKEVSELNYGNCDISNWLGNGTDTRAFWLDSSLKISPVEQIEIMRSIFEGNTIYSESEVMILKNIMLTETDGPEKIYGKTGTGTMGNAWYVGFVEKEDNKIYFAIHLNDNESKQVYGAKAKEIALDIIYDYIKKQPPIRTVTFFKV